VSAGQLRFASNCRIVGDPDGTERIGTGKSAYGELALYQRLERMTGKSETTRQVESLFFPNEVAGSRVTKQRQESAKISIYSLLTATSCGDIFRFWTARQARSHMRTNLAA